MSYLRVKTARILNMEDKRDLRRLNKLVSQRNLYGHSSHNPDDIIKDGRIISALRALKEDKLKSYESGTHLGTHSAPEKLPPLSKEHTATLDAALLVDRPNQKEVSAVAEELGYSVDKLRQAYLTQNFDKVDTFLKRTKKDDAFRSQHFGVAKLGPNIFLTKGGIMDTDAYGDTGFLLTTDKAVRSPFSNILTGESIVPPTRGLQAPALSLRGGVVLAPGEKIKAFEEANPTLTYVDRDKVPRHIKAKILKPPRSMWELPKRVWPTAIQGKLRHPGSH